METRNQEAEWMLKEADTVMREVAKEGRDAIMAETVVDRALEATR